MVRQSFLDPKTSFHFDGASFDIDGGRTVLDFWRWAYSDVFQNVTRGYVAQFIIAWLVGADKNEPNNPFQSFDIQIPDGKRIEVKSTAWLQSWRVKKPNPLFVIKPAHTWDDERGYGKEKTFNADIYALCYYYWKDMETADLLDLSQWDFWAFSKKELIEILGRSKSITIERLKKLELSPMDPIKMRDTLIALETIRSIWMTLFTLRCFLDCCQPVKFGIANFSTGNVYINKFVQSADNLNPFRKYFYFLQD